MITLKKITPLLIILIVAGLYSPGVPGPFLFDDQSSITKNPAIAIKEISKESLFKAAESGIAGPLKRPVAMISFALNYYYAGSYHAAAFKVTNIAIHCVNTLLVLVLSLQLLKLSFPNSQRLFWFAAATSLLWGTHPINLTSVLYIVQRMTSLSTLFSLASIILYLSARQQIINKGAHFKIISLFVFSSLSLALALYSKENAVVIPLIILAGELIFFSRHAPWKHLKRLNNPSKLGLFLMAALAFSYFLNDAISYASGGFKTRPFSMLERVLTEARVVSEYIANIFIPRINAFGLFHDDIPLSSSLLSPWTTLTSFIFLGALLTTGFIYRKRQPLFAFGISWFFIGHLLESTFFPLEIAHEHRNNLPSIGLILAAISLLPSLEVSKKNAISCIVIASLALSSITLLRANQWSNEYDQAYFETVHHPKSPAAHSIYSYAAFNRGLVPEALTALKKASLLSPNEAAYSIFYQHALTVTQQKVSASLQADTLRRIRNGVTSATTINALDQMASCLETKPCRPLIKNSLAWAEAMIQKHPKKYLYYYFKGKSHLANKDEKLALQAFQQGAELNNGKLHLLLEIANIFIRQHDISNLAKTIGLFKEANQIASEPKIEELKRLEQALREIKTLRDKTQKINSIKPS